MVIIRNLILMSSLVLALISKGTARDMSEGMLQDMAIPLMDGLTEDETESLLFDSPDGRIISAQASGTVDPQAAFDYYRVVLPSLGWAMEQDNNTGLICEGQADYCFRAIRDEEALLLTILKQGQNSVLTYSLSPN